MKKIIIKVGTSSLTQGTNQLSKRTMIGLVQQMAALRNRGIELILVSSGAIATGRELFQPSKMGSSQFCKQIFAAIGQVKLMQVWAELFSLYDLHVGQILLTKEDFSENKRFSTEQTIACLLDHGIIPIINENDVVFSKEVRIGDNDNLSALVANLAGADTLVLLTDQEGLYTANPRKDPDAKLISVVDCIDEQIVAIAGGSSSALGTGGMGTKIEAARLASKSLIKTIIASSSRPNVLIELADGKQVGTVFLNQREE
ncbi:MAG: glutamate 5-kinase [Verrucomicrobia bacterium]|nr:glutamate 5-kinase [Verrucomicrobiota bacterium]